MCAARFSSVSVPLNIVQLSSTRSIVFLLVTARLDILMEVIENSQSLPSCFRFLHTERDFGGVHAHVRPFVVTLYYIQQLGLEYFSNRLSY